MKVKELIKDLRHAEFIEVRVENEPYMNINSDSKGMELINEREIDNWFIVVKPSNIMADMVIDLKKEK